MTTNNISSIKNLYSLSTIVEFHIGCVPGKRDTGYAEYRGKNSITDTSSFKSLFLSPDEKKYLDQDGNEVGLTFAQAQEGVGRIEIDGEFDATFCKRISELDDEDLAVVARDAFCYEAVEIFAATGKYSEKSVLLANFCGIFNYLIEYGDVDFFFESFDEMPDADNFEFDGCYYVLKEE